MSDHHIHHLDIDRPIHHSALEEAFQFCYIQGQRENISIEEAIKLSFQALKLCADWYPLEEQKDRNDELWEKILTGLYKIHAHERSEDE